MLIVFYLFIYLEEQIGSITLRYSCRVRVAMVENFCDRWAACSAFTILARRNSEKAFDLGNVAPAGMGGPKTGTSFDRLTAT